MKKEKKKKKRKEKGMNSLNINSVKKEKKKENNIYLVLCKNLFDKPLCPTSCTNAASNALYITSCVIVKSLSCSFSNITPDVLLCDNKECKPCITSTP